MPIHDRGVGGCLQLCRHLPPPLPGSAARPLHAPSFLFFFLPTHRSGGSGGLRVGKGPTELAEPPWELGERKRELG